MRKASRIGLFGSRWLDRDFHLLLRPLEVFGLLVGEPIHRKADTGPTVYSCFGMGSNIITEAIRTRSLKTVGEVTACLQGVSNCGFCVPEIKSLIAACAR